MVIKPNTEEWERDILIEPSGFREYDARWRYPEQLNLRGVQALGLALGDMIYQTGVRPDIVVGHDYRAYSGAIKQALIIGLTAAGCRVHDIGLALSPVAYFSQFSLNCPAVAMVTASHNENGWTGVKMGMAPPLTFGPVEMKALKDKVRRHDYKHRSGGAYRYVTDIKERYIKDLTREGALKNKLKVVTACGNGTAGAYAPQVLERLGCEVIPMDCELDWTFPRYNPNPEDMKMLHALRDKVLETEADIGFAFDGDGDRCGVVDNTGQEIFADKIGVLLARYLASEKDARRFVVDVKSTGLYQTDPELDALGVETDYWITGHSYIKRRVQELNAFAGFEKSGHFFFNHPIGRGYDDGLLSAVTICRMLDRSHGQSLAEMRKTLPQSWGSPTMSPFCPDECKYDVVAKLSAHYQEAKEKGQTIMGQAIADIVTVNGVRVVLEDGTWGLVRASSNKPSLVVVVESPVSEAAMEGMFSELDRELSGFKEVGAYDQTLKQAA